MACRQERTELDRLAALRATTAAAEAELLELRALSESEPNIAEQKASEHRFRVAAASETAQQKVADGAFEAARQSERERDALLLQLTHERRALAAGFFCDECLSHSTRVFPWSGDGLEE